MTMELTQIIILIVNILLAIVIAMGGFITKGMSDRIKKLECDMDGIKTNYLNRFAEVIKNQTEAKEELTKSQTVIKTELIAQQVKVKEELVQHYQETKDKLIDAINFDPNDWPMVDFTH